MKWIALILCLLTQSLIAGPDDLKPPALTWNDVVKTIPTKKYTDTDGRIWTFRFHQSDAKLPTSTQATQFWVVLKTKCVEKYDPQSTLFTAYDILRRSGNKPWERMHLLTFYLLISAVAQKENNS